MAQKAKIQIKIENDIEMFEREIVGAQTELEKLNWNINTIKEKIRNKKDFVGYLKSILEPENDTIQ